MDANAHKDFFISYTSVDKQWAEWIAWQLEEAGYTTILQAWDFQPGSNFVLEMDRGAKKAKRTIAVLSPDYFASKFASSEWAAAFRRDPRGEQRLLVPVRVRSFDIEGLLGQIVYIDLVKQDEEAARSKVLQGVEPQRGKPTSAPAFPLTSQHTNPERPSFPGALPSVFNIPYLRNPYFTGRDNLLLRLHDLMRRNKTAVLTHPTRPAPQAISGLGGIGKTQIAIEYAYRYGYEYQYAFWIRSDTREAVISDFIAIADLLSLPTKNIQDQTIIITVVKRWLQEHTDWLLIFDNADTINVVRDYLPFGNTGHLLLTTRAQSMGSIAQPVGIEKMNLEEGALFLLRRAKIIQPDAWLTDVSPADIAQAKEIDQLVDGLPLALDQAGAYLDETGCGVAQYLELYRKQKTALLKRRGSFAPDYPHSVFNTWELSFKNVEQANPVAADLLRICAFLAPDAIPEKLLTDGASQLGPILEPVASNAFEMDAAIEELRKYSLIQRERNTQTLSIHRLVQTVLREEMSEEIQRQWAERAVRVVNYSFPLDEEAPWSRSQKYLPHALVACIDFFNQWGGSLPELAELFHKAGIYLLNRGEFEEAESHLRRGLEIREQVWGADHLETTESLEYLGVLYRDRSEFQQAESFFKHALAIREKVLGTDHFETAQSIHSLAMLYRDWGRYGEAEQLFQRTLPFYEKLEGDNSRLTANLLNNLALLYYFQRNYKLAEPLFQRALTIYEQTMGADHPYTANTLSNLANLYRDRYKFKLAWPLYQRVLEIRKLTVGDDHPDTAQILNNLGTFYRFQHNYKRAESHYRRALAIRERILGASHTHTAQTLNNLAGLYRDQGKYKQAEPLYQRALDIYQRKLGADHPSYANALNNLAALYEAQSKYGQAKLLYERALVIYEQKLGQDNPSTMKTQEKLQLLLQKMQ